MQSRLHHGAALFVPAMGMVLSLAWAASWLQASAETDVAQAQESLDVQGAARGLGLELAERSADLLVLAGAHDLRDPAAGAGPLGASAGLVSDLVHLGLTQDRIHRLRLVDASGLEVVRIDFGGGRAEVAPLDRADPHRDPAPTAPRAAQVSVSPVHADPRAGRLQGPAQPIVELTTPILDRRGALRGAALLAVLWAPLQGRLTDAYPGLGRLVLLDDAGHPVTAEPRAGLGAAASLAGDLDEAWPHIGGRWAGGFNLGATRYSFAAVQLDEPPTTSPPRRPWTVVSVAPVAAFTATTRAGLPGLLGLSAFAGLCILIGVLLLLQSRGQHQGAAAQVAALAHHDAVTRLPNRAFFGQLLTKELRRARRHRRQTGLLFVDLDDFKHVNEALGHDVGDELLRAVAARMTELVRGTDALGHSSAPRHAHVLSRLGGDEFVVLLPGVAGPEHCGRVAERLTAGLARPFVIRGAQVVVGASVGVAVAPGDGHDAEELLCSADHAMDEAKRGGKGQHRFFRDAMNDGWAEGVAVERTLRAAIARDELVVHYQPKVELPTGRPTGCEALVRLQGTGRLISPAEFLPVARRAGLLGVLSRQVLRTAVKEARRWPQAGLGALPVAVNLPAEELISDDIVSWVAELLRELDFDPSRLELEITEDQLIRQPEQAAVVLRGLKAIGVRVSIDDFGTGYSSLSYLVRMPVAGIKIDRSFVSELTRSAAGGTMISAIVELANQLGLHVVAEGIETEEQRATLAALGCVEAQGYLFARPLPAGEFRDWVRGESTSPGDCGEDDGERARPQHRGRGEAPSSEPSFGAALGEIRRAGGLPDRGGAGPDPAVRAAAVHAQAGDGRPGRTGGAAASPAGGGR